MLLLCFIAANIAVFAQETVVVGQILNAHDRSPIPDVNIYFKNTTIGVKSNEEGFFMIKTTGKETTVIFSSVGFKQREIKVKPGQSIGIQVLLTEQTTELMDVLVVPGANPALEFMRKVRQRRSQNDYSIQPDYRVSQTEQNLVLLSKIDQRSVNKRIFQQLSVGSVSDIDSSLILPLFMEERKYEVVQAQKTETAQNIFSTDKNNEKLMRQLIGDFKSGYNFYRNSIELFGKGFVSPLSATGNAYYHFYLADSTLTDNGKEYVVNFRSKNYKNLAFNGSMKIDSVTLALTEINAELPRQANLNFVHNLRVSQRFKSLSKSYFVLNSELITLNMSYEMLADSLRPKPEIFISKSLSSASLTQHPDTKTNSFAQSNYDAETLDDKMISLQETEIVKTAKWIADVIITGYIPMGKLDFGKIQNIARLTDEEGLRLNIPLRTNEKFSKSIGINGYAGYGFGNKEMKYSVGAQYKLPVKKRTLFGISYTNDYRRVDYDYNDFLLRENPLQSGDFDIAGTIFAFNSVGNLNERKEFSASLQHDWSKDIESSLIFRSNNILSGYWLSFIQNGSTLQAIQNNTLTFSSRFSFDERVYDDHFQRIYIANNKPVIYAIAEAGQFQAGNKQGNYLKTSFVLKQQLAFGFGRWNYALEAGKIFGTVPYHLLEIPSGTESASGYRKLQFNEINFMEYAADQYISMHNEIILNGLVMNNIPLIKHLNLREMFSFKLFYGSLKNTHAELIDYPVNFYSTQKPYMEVGAGFSNILRLFTLQSVWRLTDLDHPGANRWSLRGSIRVSF